MFLGPKIIIGADFLGVHELNVKYILEFVFLPSSPSFLKQVFFRGALDSHSITVLNSHIYATCVYLLDRAITSLPLAEQLQL